MTHTLRAISTKVTGILAASIVLLAVPAHQANAVTSFSRLYKMGCTACHSTMPRLNYFGEKLLLRGNELDRMGAADLPKAHLEVERGARCTSCHNDGRKGEEVGAEKFARDLFLHTVSNLLSFRTKITLAALETNKLSEGGQKKSRRTLGKSDWIQLWVAGPVAKNITVRVEAELVDGNTVGLHNHAVAFSNVLGSPEGLLNLRIGGFTDGEWIAISDRSGLSHRTLTCMRSARPVVPARMRTRWRAPSWRKSASATRRRRRRTPTSTVRRRQGRPSRAPRALPEPERGRAAGWLRGRRGVLDLRPALVEVERLEGRALLVVTTAALLLDRRLVRVPGEAGGN